jgi:hypothetical protein
VGDSFPGFWVQFFNSSTVLQPFGLARFSV